MKFSWRVLVLWALPVLVIGFFLWQSTLGGQTMGMTQNRASSRMTYGRFLEYLDAGRVKSVDLYDLGRTAIVEAVDPDLNERVQSLRVELPGMTPELMGRLRL